jgi:hypothetical protein
VDETTSSHVRLSTGLLLYMGEDSISSHIKVCSLFGRMTPSPGGVTWESHRTFKASGPGALWEARALLAFGVLPGRRSLRFIGCLGYIQPVERAAEQSGRISDLAHGQGMEASVARHGCQGGSITAQEGQTCVVDTV